MRVVLYHCFVIIGLQKKQGRQKSLSALLAQQGMHLFVCLFRLQAAPAVRFIPFLQRLSEGRKKPTLKMIYTSTIEIMGLSVFADGDHVPGSGPQYARRRRECRGTLPGILSPGEFVRDQPASRWLIPQAYSARIFSSIPSAFRSYFSMIFGSYFPCRSPLFRYTQTVRGSYFPFWRRRCHSVDIFAR